MRNKIDDKIKMDNGRFSAAAAAAAGWQNEVGRMCRRRVDGLPKRKRLKRARDDVDGGVNSVRREPRARLVRLTRLSLSLSLALRQLKTSFSLSPPSLLLLRAIALSLSFTFI